MKIKQGDIVQILAGNDAENLRDIIDIAGKGANLIQGRTESD